MEFDGIWREVDFFTHRVRLKELLEKDAICVYNSIGIGNHIFFMFLVMISTFKIIDF
jgi:hypothetical protein